MTLQQIEDAARAEHLAVMGGLHEDGETVLLLGPGEPGFWTWVQTSPEFTDGAPDRLDRWSARVIGALAANLGARAIFPYDGPPYAPFIAWALASGQAWQSPVNLLIHAEAGLWASYRGALILSGEVGLGAPAANPCPACDAPCTTACPVAALTPDGYDADACRSYVASPEGTACRYQGCAVRRACPVSASYPRVEAQSAFHMTHFLKDP